MEEPGFWDDADKSTKLVREAKNLKDTVETYNGLERQFEDIQVMIEMGYEENDPSLIPEIQEMLDEFQKDFDNIRIKTLLSGEYDSEKGSCGRPSPGYRSSRCADPFVLKGPDCIRRSGASNSGSAT